MLLAHLALAILALDTRIGHDDSPPMAALQSAVPKGVAPLDWSNIRAAYDAGRHAVVAVNGGFQARNPGQRWLTHFDGRGFTTTPDAGGWIWGLDLANYGFDGQEHAISGLAHVKSEGGRISYAWGTNLTEWYVNDSRGLEHGYTIHRRPAAGEGLLHLTLKSRGDLRARVLNDGRGVRFFDAANTSIVDYSGLTVTDASGQVLPAHFEQAGKRLVVKIDESDACYPITIDPVAQQAYVKASNSGPFDAFGWSVSASGDTVVVGAYSEDSNAMGVNGDQSNNGALHSGAAYVFVRNGTNWSQQAYLKASNAESGDFFGYSVSVSGNTIVVGAFQEGSNATGVNGNQSNNSAPGSGAAYVFVRNGANWSQQAYLKASNSESSDSFGISVSISGDSLVSGAYLESSVATGVNGNQSSNSVPGSGAAYVFVRSGTSWSQQAYVKASNTGANDWFSRSVAISGDSMVVGAYQEDSNATGVNGDQSSNSSAASGAAYVFVRSGTNWIQQAYLKASNTDANDWFGWSISMSMNTIVVGAYSEDSGTTGVNGNQSDNGATQSGAAYVFVRNGTIWAQQAYLKSSNTESDDTFGVSVSVSGEIIAVGAVSLSGGEDSDATGVNGDQSNNNAPGSGAAYVFVRSGTTWSQQAYLKASNTEPADNFGISVCVSGDGVVVGAHREDSGAIGDQNDNSSFDSGAAYIFDLDNNPGTASYGSGTPGCAGTQTLGVNQAPMIGSPAFAITCDNAPPSSLGLGIVADAQDLLGSDPFALGVLLHVNLLTATEILSFDFVSDASGNGLTVNTGIPNSVALVGQTYYAMALWAWSSCSLPPYNLSTSRGLAITIQAP